MVYDMDFVHSAIFAKDAALVDQQINDGASFNPDLVYGQGRVGVLMHHPWHPAQPFLVAYVETISENPQLTFVVTSAIIRCLLISNSVACMMHGFMYSKKGAVTVSVYDLTNYSFSPIKATVITGVISATPVSNAYLMNALVREDLGFGGEVQTTLRSASSRTSVALHATRSKLYFFLFDTLMFSSENFPLISSECGDLVVLELVSKPTVLLQNNDSTL
ncbi:hypothetical protein PI124_g15265 [Phytophthora idaei]|nr:hypothetical protein PI125_g24266 [Phytophthora idaei]KAG3126669.1 hypothetical protein PI126_g22224 [Phytophthora idaei]KAG3239804.1 hypothetical protein PI124_g15265 [Phytophthora idaei]